MIDFLIATECPFQTTSALGEVLLGLSGVTVIDRTLEAYREITPTSQPPKVSDYGKKIGSFFVLDRDGSSMIKELLRAVSRRTPVDDAMIILCGEAE